MTVDVLIVGAGPTGTALAIDLTRRGVTVRLIDRATSAFDGSRAKGIQPRTLEVLEDLGALPEVLDRGSLYPQLGIHLGPVILPRRMMAKGTPSPDVPYPDTWLIPQYSTDRALHARLEALGGRVEFGTELVDFTAGPTGVSARLSTADGTEDVSARYLVGADGGGSRVRKQAGIEFDGSTDDADRILIVDSTVAGDLSRRYWHIWPGMRGRFIGACPLPHSDLFQWMIRLAPDEDPPGDADAITRRIRSHTRDRSLAVRDIRWQSVFRPNVRLARRYRRGPVLLAGDAAHVHTPAGAQGLNTGIGDAYNLGWKLAQVLAGADEKLLDTYEAERRPVAAGVLGLSSKRYEGLGRFAPSSMRRGPDEQQLTLTYRDGPLASAAGTATLRVGDRAPDAVLRAPSGTPLRLFEAFRGPHFTAIAYGRSSPRLDWPSAGARLERLAVESGAEDSLTDPTGEFARTYGLTGDTVVLVRPDGYIGGLGDAPRFAFPAGQHSGHHL
ncbi:FAD-dependent monooxygenase [Pseudonocardia spinosispora]|uniref:FAD-dependent monooxygenase n=1 Tax=Pseudonocardia spinosispora TaxID=103441 RepID=UPI00041A1AAB|nr:FAD-dependent monooxygenase [Pseudonocardia spinosispora]